MTKMKNTQKRENHQKQYIQNLFFLQNRTKTKMEKIAYCVITFNPKKKQTHSAPQNDRLNFRRKKQKFGLKQL